MPIEFSCSQCQRTLRVPDDSAGRGARCPQCGMISTVPSPAPAPPEFPQPIAPPPTQTDHENPYSTPYSDAQPFATDHAAEHADYRNPAAWATLGDRLGGAILDGLIGFAAALPGLGVMFLPQITGGMNMGGREAGSILGFLLVICGVLAVAGYQWYLISTTGQSIGKKVVGTRIVDFDNGSNPGFVRAVILRLWVPGAIGGVPGIGGCFGLINILWIFGSERRCLHDLIANTRVIRD